MIESINTPKSTIIATELLNLMLNQGETIEGLLMKGWFIDTSCTDGREKDER